MTAQRVEFTGVPFPEGTVNELVELSRLVLARNGNRTHNHRIALITDDLFIAQLGLDAAVYDAGDFDPREYTSQFVGFCWHNNGNRVLWVKNKFKHDLSPQGTQDTHYRKTLEREMATTLCHEVAHALSTSCHDRTFRRAFSILIPFYVNTLVEPLVSRRAITTLTKFTEIDKSVERIVYQYAKPARRVTTSGWDEFKSRREVEITGHKLAARRSWDRWSHCVV